ncbi:hypothetical protein GPA27_12470 [Aromatoleum toluolicum]|uniref:ParB/Sulfiredoxin domain-containing protein n=1 Tax=Aromatoleum toluolicum TaxID=90060 RepID=A0ABX1NG85_9RHOO|nr:hypothetical protein [Aromatoleum toluolicum]NMF98200.1 hypothetical protein [Aromatoleum toluolicum]
MSEHTARPASAIATRLPVRKSLELSLIRLDGGTQPRVEINLDTVAEYAEAAAEQAKFPPIVVFFDGAAHWLADGFHRYHGTKQAGYPTILAEIRNGAKRDAVLYGLSANTRHGLRETRADKHRKIEILLRDAEWVEWADREIARRCGVHHETVAAVRAELEASGEIRQIEARTVERNGTIFTQSARIEPAVSDEGVPVAHDEDPHAVPRADNVDGQQPTALAPSFAIQNAPQKSVTPQQQADQAEPDEPPAVAPEPGEVERLRAEVADLRAANAELAKNLEDAVADNEAMTRIVEADDKVTAALAEAEQYRKQVCMLEERNRGLTNEKNEAVRAVKYWRTKAEAAEKREVTV